VGGHEGRRRRLVRRDDLLRRLAAALVVLGGTVIGCTNDEVPPRTTAVVPDPGSPLSWSEAGGLPCGTLNAGSPMSRTLGHFVVTPLAEFVYEDARSQVRPRALWGHYFAYTLGHDRIVVCDLDTGSTTTAAQAPSGGALDVIAGSKDFVVWSPSTRVPDTGQPSTAWTGWTMEALDLRTGTHHLLDRSESDKKSPETEFGKLPFPEVDWPWVTWLHPVNQKDAELWSFDFRSGQRRVIATVPIGGRTAMADGLVVYDHVTSKDYLERDLYSVPADGSRRPRRLIDLDGGQWPRAGDGRAAWTVRPTTSRSLDTRDRDTWMYPLADRGGPIRLGPGSGPRPGNGFILVNDGESLHMYDPAHPGEPSVEFASSRELGGASIGIVWHDLVLWGGGDPPRGDTRHLRLSRISVAPNAVP
jgi:hypothetical protein